LAHPLERLHGGGGEPVTVTWNGRPVTGRAGDTLAAALHASGVRTLTRSRKFRAPRGLSGSFVAGHLATVDGVPHSRLDRIAATPGQCVAMENVWPSPAFDLTALAGLLPRRMVRAGFEHPRLIPDASPLWRPWERLLWHMAGEADPPPEPSSGAVPGRRLATGTLVVGGGPAGLAAARSATGPVVLVTRSDAPGGMALGAGAGGIDLPDTVTVLTGHEVVGLFDGARNALVVPNDPAGPALLVTPASIVLATGVWSVPALVPGMERPGVLDARMALMLAVRHGVPPGRAIVVAGTDGCQDVADRLAGLGCRIVAVVDAADLEAVEGGAGVAAVRAGGTRIPCDALVHAGPWRADPVLPFQAGAGGDLRLLAGAMPDHVSACGACSGPDEPVSFGRALDRSALVCPCMDVTVDEILDLIAAGVTHVEELKRRSTCGMGACQGVPCWDTLVAVLAHATGQAPGDIAPPTYRPPRGGITLGQAAGLADLVEVAP